MRKTRRTFLKKAALGGLASTLFTSATTNQINAEEEKKPKRRSKAKGIALALGLNSLDPTHYTGWDGKLNACENDADLMESIAKKQNFSEVTKLITKEATRKNFFKEIKSAADKLKSGDLFVLSYSGHGGQVPDHDGNEVDDLDETWCLFDGQVIDDELYNAWSQFQPGVRIVVFSDSCHSGTVTKSYFYAGLDSYLSNLDKTAIWDDSIDSPIKYSLPQMRKNKSLSERFKSLDRRSSFNAKGKSYRPQYRFMPMDNSFSTYKENRKFYDQIFANIKDNNAIIEASVLLISGCQDNQFSLDGWEHGKFTGKLKKVWNEGNFTGNYRKFHKAILHGMPSTQSPNYYFNGKPNQKFEDQKPYTV